MKIAVWHNLPSGGAKRTLNDHVRGLLARGHEVEVWYPPTANQDFSPLSGLVKEHVVPLHLPVLSQNPLRRILNPYFRTVRLLHAMDDHCRRCATEINAGGFDFFFGQACTFLRTTAISRYVHGPKTIFLGEPYRWLYEALPQLPWVAPPSTHRWWKPRYTAERWRDSLKVHGLRIQAREELESARAYTLILTNSLFSRESILRAYGVEAQVCYPGVDLALFRDQGLPREDFVVSIGALTWEKNAQFIIGALALLPEPRPKLVWIANVASPSFQAWITRYAAEQGVEFDLHLNIPDAAMLDLLNRARLLAYAPRLEPLGLAPLEANACGTPVVAVAEGGVRETVQDGVSGFLVQPEIAAMAQAIQRLRDDPDLAAELGALGKERVAEFWSVAAADERLERRFAEVLAKYHKDNAV